MLKYEKDYLASKNISKSYSSSIKSTFKHYERYLSLTNIMNDAREWDENTFTQFYQYLSDYEYTMADNSKTGYCKDKSKRHYVTRHYSKNAIAHIMQNMKSFMRYLVENNRIFKNPLEQVKMISQKRTAPKRVISEIEMNKFSKAIDIYSFLGYRDRTMLETYYGTGIRLSEGVGLNTDSINLEEGIIIIRKGKFSKDRIIPIGDVAVIYIKEYLKNVRPYLLSIENMSETALFLNRNGGRITRNGIEHMFSKYSRLSGAKISPHMLRHAYSVHLLQNGCSIRHIQELLGHMELDTTVIYTQIMDKDLMGKVNNYHPCNSWK